jgi:hypothetical protein
MRFRWNISNRTIILACAAVAITATAGLVLQRSIIRSQGIALEGNAMRNLVLSAENARDGSAGKGFSVVANEIKALAKQTASATEDAKVRVASVQSFASTGVGAIEQISGVIGEVTEIVSSIAAAIEEQATVTKDISRNIGEASTGARDVNQQIAESSAVTRGIGRCC